MTTSVPPAPTPAANPAGTQVTDASRSDTPRPWARWLARLLDLTWSGFVVGFALALLGFAEFATRADNKIILILLNVAAFAVIESVLLAGFGTTPGKALLNIRVEHAGAGPLPLSLCVGRALRVWWSGMGLGVPLVNLLTMARQHGMLTRTGATSYDRALGTRVTHGRVGGGRALAVVAAVAVAVWLMVP